MSKNKEDNVFIAVRVTKTMKQLLEKAIKQDTHMNESEFVRDAVREKLTRMGFRLVEVS